MKNLRKLLSVILAAAVTLSLVPAVFATDGEEAPVLQSTPSPERIFEVINDLHIDDVGSVYGELGWIPAVNEETGEPENINDYINADGTLTDLFKESLGEMYADEEFFGDAPFVENYVNGLANAETLYDILEVYVFVAYDFIEYIYTEMITVLEEEMPDEAEAMRDELDRFHADYPTSDDLLTKVINDYFDGNENPDFISVLTFISSDPTIRIEEDGTVMEYTAAPIGTDDEYYFVSDFIAPNGAYTKDGYDLSGGHDNVYLQLKNMWDNGEISNEDAFAILFGYAPDMNGYLYSVVPEYDTMYDENGKRLTSLKSLINPDGTVMDSGLSVRDYAIDAVMNGRDFLYVDYEDPEYGDTDGIETFFLDLIQEYMSGIINLISDALGGIITDEDLAAGEMSFEEAAEIVDEYLSFLETDELTEDEINEDILWMYGGFSTDFFGYIAKGYTNKYLRNSEGNKLTLSDVMDEDGKLLYPEMGDTVAAEMEKLFANMNYDAELLGDANGDRKINISDVSVLLKKLAKWDVEVSDAAADVNGDAKTNISDVSLMLKYLAQWDVYFAY